MTKDCVMTITLPIDVVGTKGTKLRLIPFRQYCYIEKGFYERECFEPGCGPLGVHKRAGFIIDINDEQFIVWATNATDTIELKTDIEQMPVGEYQRYRMTTELPVKDYKKIVKEQLGIDIKKNERTDYNGRWLQEIIDNKPKS